MNVKTCFATAVALSFLVAFSAAAQDTANPGQSVPANGGADEEEEERELFERWHVDVGVAFNTRIRSDIKMGNLPTPGRMLYSSGSPSKAAAFAKAQAHRYDGGGFIATDSDDDGRFTTNWRLPESDYLGDGQFILHNAYRGSVKSSTASSYHDHSDERHQFGLSVDISRELWIHGGHEDDEASEEEKKRREMEDGQREEEREHRWGIDFAAALSYFFARDIYDGCASVRRTDSVKNGEFLTPVNDSDATFFYDMGWDSPKDGMYGYGAYDTMSGGPSLEFAGIGDTYDVPGGSTRKSASRRYRADGDYRELELLLMLRPWYEIKDWWRIFAEAGLGISWGRFDTTIRGTGLVHEENFRQRDFYGVVGLGTAFRYDDFTIGVDAVYRFLRDDFEVDGKYLDGEIHRADWGCRVMVGYEF